LGINWFELPPVPGRLLPLLAVLITWPLLSTWRNNSDNLLGYCVLALLLPVSADLCLVVVLDPFKPLEPDIETGYYYIGSNEGEVLGGGIEP